MSLTFDSGVFDPLAFDTSPTPSPPVPPAPVPPQVRLMSATVGRFLGTDIKAIDDLPPDFGLVSGPDNLACALARRLDTPPGALEQIGDDPDYGLRVRDFLNREISSGDLSALAGAINAEVAKDQRVASVDAGVAITASTDVVGSYALRSQIDVETDDGPFAFVLGIDQVSTSLIGGQITENAG